MAKKNEKPKKQKPNVPAPPQVTPVTNEPPIEPIPYGDDTPDPIPIPQPTDAPTTEWKPHKRLKGYNKLSNKGKKKLKEIRESNRSILGAYDETDEGLLVVSGDIPSGFFTLTLKREKGPSPTIMSSRAIDINDFLDNVDEHFANESEG